METLQSIIFIEFDVNTKKITFLRGDNIIDYDSNVTSVYVRVKYKNLSGNTVYLTPSELEDYEFSLYTIKPATNNVNVIAGEVTDELKENVYGGIVKFEIPRVCTNRLGIVKCEIHINQENKMIASSTFVLDVKQSLVTAFDDELLGDEDFPVLRQLILEIQKANYIDDNNISKLTTYSSDKIENIKEDLSSQIKEKANLKDMNFLNLMNYTDTNIPINEYSYYQTIIKNEMNFDRKDEIVGIFINFDKGCCINENFLRVYDGNTELDFQIEIDKNNKTLVENGLYSDGSIKSCTIFINIDLAANEEKEITIKLYDNEQTHNFISKVNETKDTDLWSLSTDTVKLEFVGGDKKWACENCYINDKNITTNSTFIYNAIINGSMSDMNSNSKIRVNVLDNKILGNGVIFKDYYIKLEFCHDTSIICEQYIRLYCNNKIDVETRYNILNLVPSANYGGFIQKIGFDSNTSESLLNEHSDDKVYTINEYNDYKIITGIYDLQSGCDYFRNNYPTYFSPSSNGITYNRLNSGVRSNGQTFVDVPAKSYFSIRGYISLNYKNDKYDEILIRKNKIFCKATKYTKDELKRRYISLSLKYIENMISYSESQNRNNYYGLRALMFEYSNILLGYKQDEDKVKYFITKMLDWYTNGNLGGFYNSWKNGRGIEFSGRDIIGIEYLIKDNPEYEQYIHNFANDLVRIEEESGGDGSIPLRYGTSDNMNAEASALRVMALSLKYKEDEKVRNSANRILERFLSGFEFLNIAPYAKASGTSINSIKHPTIHYHAFCMYDYLFSDYGKNSTSTKPSIRNYIFQATTASGQIKEIGYQYNSDRRGMAHTQLYISSILAVFGGNISDLAQACTLLEYVLNRTLPTGYHENGIDGYISTPTSGGEVECQILIESILKLIDN